MRKTRWLAALALAVGPLLAAPALAQEAPSQIRIVEEDVFVRSGPSASETIVVAVPSGTVLPMAGRDGEWIRVTVTPELGVAASQGYVHQSVVQIVTAGTPLEAQVKPTYKIRGYKDPTAATLFSVVLPGGGQMYAGETGRGFLILAGAFGSLIVGGAIAGDDQENEEVGGAIAAIGFLSFWIYGMIDAGDAAHRTNEKRGIEIVELAPYIQPDHEGSKVGLAARVRF